MWTVQPDQMVRLPRFSIPLPDPPLRHPTPKWDTITRRFRHPAPSPDGSAAARSTNCRNSAAAPVGSAGLHPTFANVARRLHPLRPGKDCRSRWVRLHPPDLHERHPKVSSVPARQMSPLPVGSAGLRPTITNVARRLRPLRPGTDCRPRLGPLMVTAPAANNAE